MYHSVYLWWKIESADKGDKTEHNLKAGVNMWFVITVIVRQDVDGHLAPP